MNKHRTTVFHAAALVLLLGGLEQAHAQAPGTVDLIPTPPELTATVAPNVMVTFDDSGSMGRHFMPDSRPYDNAGWGVPRDDQNNVHNNRYDAAVPWLCAAVIDPRITDESNPRSYPMNGVYYNPNITYRKPLYADGVTEFPTPTFTNAWNNGVIRNRPTAPDTSDAIADPGTAGTRGTRNLSTARFCTNNTTNNGAGYYRYRSTATALTVDAQGRITNTAALYTAGNWEWVALPTAERTNFAIWWSYYHTRALAATTAMSRAFASFDDNVRVAWQNLNTNNIGTATQIFKFKNEAVNTNVRNRFYDWLFTMPVGGGTPTLDATIRAGNFYRRGTAPIGFAGAVDTNPYWDRDLGRELSCRQNFHFNVSDGFWNQTAPGVASVVPRDTTPASQTLPDGRTYSTSDTESRVFWADSDAGANVVSLADIAWRYWATNLRPDFALNVNTRNKVVPFVPDQSTNLFGNTNIPDGVLLNNKEIYWNPANDPATWSHMVNFMISFGVDGTFKQNEANLAGFRNGNLRWPTTTANVIQNIDDMWHAALNSRGRSFVASNPNELITALQEVVASIIARRGGVTAATTSIPLLTDSTTRYQAGFDSSDWSGSLVRQNISPVSGATLSVRWDAGCILTGGLCRTTGQSGSPTDPNSRVIQTSLGTPGSARPFRWGSLSTTQRARLNVKPQSLRLDLVPAVVEADTFGERRVNYLRGDRTHESTDNPRFRKRSSLLGAIIRGQPTYVSSPVSGYSGSFPSGSPERAAADAGAGYDRYLNDQRQRRPMVYVAANDGMLHGFDGGTGAERFAYVPNIVINNYRLVKSTQNEVGLVPTLDDRAMQGDAFVSNPSSGGGKAWRTLLLGGLRLGGRGVYALDVTRPDSFSESNTGVLMWEFGAAAPETGGGVDCQPGARFCSSLGYTYQSINMTRIASGNRWVALISSGYFPKDSLDPASTSAAAARTSLMVVDVETGQLIREIRTSTAPQFGSVLATYGLSLAVPRDMNGDNVSEFAVAGDLAGNLWRFDLSAENPNDWKVDLMFKTYGGGGSATPGVYPFQHGATGMADRAARVPIHVIGTGKFIGLEDRTANIPAQYFFGIRDWGTCTSSNATACSRYPMTMSSLVNRQIVQDGNGVRSVPDNATNNVAIALTNNGWKLPLNITSEPGERANDIAFPFYQANAVLLRTVIPSGVDPCDPGARYGLMVFDAANGRAFNADFTAPTLNVLVGGVLRLSTPPPDPTERIGGGLVILPPDAGGGGNCDDDDAECQAREAVEAALNGTGNGPGAALDRIWHRSGWGELQEN